MIENNFILLPRLRFILSLPPWSINSTIQANSIILPLAIPINAEAAIKVRPDEITSSTINIRGVDGIEQVEDELVDETESLVSFELLFWISSASLC